MSDSDVGEAVFFYMGGGGQAPEGPGMESTSSSSSSAWMPPGGVDLPPEEGGPEGPGGPPEYDANGNLKSYNGWTYVYDAQNRLRTAHENGVLRATYYYDGKNRQIARNLNSEIRFSVWDGWELIEEYGSNRAVAYLQGATGVIKSWTQTSIIYYYQDKLGSTTHIASGSGQLLESFHYDLYGNPTGTSAQGVVDLYAGERWIGLLGLYDLRNRFMSPELGRFLQADPIGFKGDASNLYRYCGNDSANRTDPMGLYSALTIKGGGDWIADSRGISYREAELISNARIQEDINNFERRMNVDRPDGQSVKWSGTYRRIHDPSHSFKKGQTAVTEWRVKSTASAEKGKITCFDNELEVTVQWNDSASKYAQYRAMLNRGGEIEHFRDALRAGHYANGHGHRQFSSARDIGDRASRGLIGREMPLEVAETSMQDSLGSWTRESMADSHREWDVWGRHIFVDR